MTESAYYPMFVVASEEALPPAQRVWSADGWLPPEQREALDWLTLSRLLGWGVRVGRLVGPGLGAGLPGRSRWIVLACDPDRLGEDLVALLACKLAAEPILVVGRAGASNGPLARLAGAARRPEQVSGRSLRWTGPGPERSWHCRKTLKANTLEASKETLTWATLDDAPMIVARRFGRGVVVSLAFHPSQARDSDGAATALLKNLLIWGSPSPVAWFHLEGTLILRMDDPGGAQNVHSRRWYYPKLGEAEWAAIGADLRRRNGRMSIGYVPAWVDDGDDSRGDLKVSGRGIPRVPGRVYPSPLVKYEDRAGHKPGTLHDYEAEYRGIQALRAAGLGDVELHGYTHMHPDTSAWAEAPDRYEATPWYRELGRAATESIAARPPDEHPLVLGMKALRRYFNIFPTTLICPGDEWTTDVLERALDLGFQLVSTYYLAIRDEARFCWCNHICSPYLHKADAAWFDAGLPVVGYFHDYDAAVKGEDWVSTFLDQWQGAGATRLLDFRELAATIGRRINLAGSGTEPRLSLTNEDAPPLVRPLPVGIRFPTRRLPSQIPVTLDGEELLVDVYPLGEGLGRVTLPLPCDRKKRASGDERVKRKL